MKKLLLITLVILVAMSFLTGCADNVTANKSEVQAVTLDKVYMQTGIVTAVNETEDSWYANVVDVNGDEWALEVDGDTEIGQELVFWNTTDGTETLEDDLTITVVSKEFLRCIDSMVVDRVEGDKAVIEIFYLQKNTTFFDVDCFNLYEGQRLY